MSHFKTLEIDDIEHYLQPKLPKRDFTEMRNTPCSQRCTLYTPVQNKVVKNNMTSQNIN